MLETFAEYGIDLPNTASGEHDTTCPECSPGRKKKSDRCLSVNADEGTWFCHHCGWSGALKQEKPDTPRRSKPKAYTRPKAAPTTDLAPEALKWMTNDRRIPEPVIRRNKVASGTVWMPQLEKEVSVIQFPYYRDGELINIKHRDGRKNFRMEKGAERILWGLDDIDPECTVIVEGEIDKLACEAAGWQACVSVPDGAPSPNTKNYSAKFDFLDADEDKLRSVKRWILAVDGDEPGERLKDELSRRFGREKCLTVEWPEGCKDANDVLIKHGGEDLAEVLSEAQPYPIEGAFTVMDVRDRVLRLYEHGWEKGVSTGWPQLDHYYTVRPGEFTVVTGIPNSGKSNWIDALTVNLAAHHGWRIAVFSPENQPLEDHMARIIEKWSGMPFHDGPNQRMDRGGLDSAMVWAHRHFTWILPDDDADWTIDVVLDRARQLVYRQGIRGLVIDPWNELEHMCPRDMTETQYISMSLKRIRQFGRRHGVHIWVVVHPQKLHKDKSGNYPVPTLYDCAGSAHWRNKADNGIAIWRDFGAADKTVEIHVQKIRFRQIGKLGMARLTYQPVTESYQDPSVRSGRTYASESGGAA